ncbi:DUF3797 domain-containing protein [Geomicrobium sediminis]|nr:DUF3797 domain-containing protein [Geomicrobium sediminis]
MDKYSECPECGNTNLGNGEGELIVTGTSYHRSCKCGWVVRYES